MGDEECVYNFEEEEGAIPILGARSKSSSV